MKEDIELLERRMRYSEKQFENEGEYAYLGDEEIQAIENLIKAYKELERENQMLKNTKNNCPHLSTSGVNCNIKDSISKNELKQIIQKIINFNDIDRETLLQLIKLVGGKL